VLPFYQEAGDADGVRGQVAARQAAVAARMLG
jgi:hypothetical protein